MQNRYELTDEQWNQIKSLFPVYKTDRPPKKDNRFMFNALLWIARSGAPWRDLPDRYGSWKTCYSRFHLWRDIGLLATLFSDLISNPDMESLSIDSTSVKAHHHSAGAKKGYQS